MSTELTFNQQAVAEGTIERGDSFVYVVELDLTPVEGFKGYRGLASGVATTGYRATEHRAQEYARLHGVEAWIVEPGESDKETEVTFRGTFAGLMALAATQIGDPSIDTPEGHAAVMGILNRRRRH